MYTSIEQAKAHLNIDFKYMRDESRFYASIRSYLEECFHQSFKLRSDKLRYFDTVITVSRDNTGDICIKRTDDATDYCWLLSPTNDTCNYWDDYNDGYFNSTDCDEYVEEVLWTLHETLVENGIIKHKDMLNN